jgi:hypothetical protein
MANLPLLQETSEEDVETDIDGEAYDPGGEGERVDGFSLNLEF